MTKSILITGHTGNVGIACHAHFQVKGWDITGVSRSSNLDLRDWESTSQWIEQHDPFDIVVMAHGVQKPIRLKDLTQSIWQDIISNNLDASASLTTALIRHNKVNESGLVVYFSSIQATQPREGRGAYAAAKAGIEGLTRAASVEWQKNNVRTVCLRIGQMTHPMKGIGFTADAIKKLNEAIPHAWVGGIEIAKFVLALYDQISLSGETIEISSGHKYNIWPK